MNHFKILNSDVDCLRKIRSIYFKPKKDNLNNKAKAVLKINSDCLRKNPSVSVILVGFSDDEEIKEFKDSLSRRRAAVVREYLVKLGIKKTRLRIRSGKGSALAVSEKRKPQDKRRRVDFLIEWPRSGCDYKDDECSTAEETICVPRDKPCLFENHCEASEINCKSKDLECFREPPPSCPKCETGDVDECDNFDKICLINDDDNCENDITCSSADPTTCPKEEGAPCLFAEKPSCTKKDTCMFDVGVCLLDHKGCGSRESKGGGGQPS